MKYLFLLLMLSFSAHAGEMCFDCQEPVVDGQSGDPMYLASAGDELQLDTRAMTIPDGFKMVRVSHPPQFTCTEIPQPDTFELQPVVKKARVVRPKVSMDQANALKQLLEAKQ